MANQRHSYVEFYPSDWMGGTGYMPASVEWLYLQVCLYNWDKGEPLPATEAGLRFSRSASWVVDLDTLLLAGKIVKTEAGGLFVARAITSANKARDLWERKSRGGRTRQAAENKGETPDGSNTPASTPPKTPASNQNQNQNQTLLDGESPPDPPAGDLLFSVPADALRDWRAHRTKIRHPMTLKAESLIVAKLEKISREHGHDPTAVINQSIINGWRGVFPLKGDEDDGRASGQGAGTRRKGRDDGFNRAVDRGLGRC